MTYVNEVKNAYTYYLEEKINKIYGMSVNPNVSLDTMKNNIYNYIWNATYKYLDSYGNTRYTKKQWFIDTMNSLNDKRDIYYFCRNSINKAKETPTTKTTRTI